MLRNPLGVALKGSLTSWLEVGFSVTVAILLPFLRASQLGHGLDLSVKVATLLPFLKASRFEWENRALSQGT